MKFGDYLEAGRPVIAVVGATKTGKTTIADAIQKRTGGQVFHAREFYRDVIVPEYYRHTGRSKQPGQTFRDQTVDAADWFYARDPAMMVSLMRDYALVEKEPFILESLRVKGDVEELAKYENVLFVVVEADDKTRVQRLLNASDNIDGRVTKQNAYEIIRENDRHYRVAETVAFAKGLKNSVGIETSGLRSAIPSLESVIGGVRHAR